MIYLYFDSKFEEKRSGFQEAYLKLRYKIISAYNLVGFILVTAGLLLGITQALKIGLSFDVKLTSALVVWIYYLSLILLLVISSLKKIDRRRLISQLSLVGIAIIIINLTATRLLGSAHPFR